MHAAFFNSFTMIDRIIETYSIKIQVFGRVFDLKRLPHFKTTVFTTHHPNKTRFWRRWAPRSCLSSNLLPKRNKKESAGKVYKPHACRIEKQSYENHELNQRFLISSYVVIVNWTLLQICVAVLLDRYFSKEKFETKRTKSPVNYISRCVSCGKIYASVFDSMM